MAGDIRGILENILLDQNQHAPANKMIHQYFWSGLCCFMLLFYVVWDVYYIWWGVDFRNIKKVCSV